MKNIYIVLIMLMMCVPMGRSKVEAAVSIDVIDTPVHNSTSKSASSLIATSYIGDIKTTVVKVIEFVLPNGGIASYNSTLNIGENIDLFLNYTYASWFNKGSWNDSPNSDGQLYLAAQSPKKSDQDSIYFKESLPIENGRPYITSTDSSVLRCDGYFTCKAMSPGQATIKVSFYNTYQDYPYRALGTKLGFGKINLAATTHRDTKGWIGIDDKVTVPYRFEPIYFKVTVNPRPNIAGYASCLPTTNMSTTGGTFNWGYNDPEGDAQTNYHFQLSSSSDFNERDIKYQAAYSWNQNNSYGSMNQQGGSVNIPEGILLPDTTYHTRIAYFNPINGWGNGFMGCGPSFKTLPAPPPPPIPKPIGAVGSCIDKSQTGNITWTNAAGYNTAYMRVIDKTLYPNLTNEQLSNRGEYTKQWNENFVGNSYNFTTIPGHKYDWWMHTKDTNIADTTYQNYSEPVYGEFTCPIPDGICNNTAKNVCISPTSATSITETNTEYKWSCPGFSPSDKTDLCSLLKTPPECTTEPCPPPPPCANPPCGTVPPGGGTLVKPTISILKTPSVTLNKNGSCKLDWTLSNMPTAVSCSLSGWGVGGNVSSVGTKTLDTTNVSGSEIITNLQSNQRYTITCSGGTLTTPVSESVICRVNPDIKEN